MPSSGDLILGASILTAEYEMNRYFQFCKTGLV